MDESQQTKRARISWKDPNVVKTFLESCIQEVALNEREGGGLKALSWKKVSEKLKNTHKFDVDRKQMKNHMDYLKGKYGAWLKLKNKTGNIYDPSTNTFKLTAEEWEIEIKANRYVESLRSTQLPFPELCAQLFDGAMAKGINELGPTSTVPTINVDNCLFDDVDEDVNVAPQKKSVQGATQAKKRKEKVSLSVLEEKIMDVLNIISATAKPTHPSYDDCLSVLDSLGWDSDDLLYDTAHAIISDEKGNYRNAWMKMKPERRENWVKMIGRKLGMI